MEKEEKQNKKGKYKRIKILTGGENQREKDGEKEGEIRKKKED